MKQIKKELISYVEDLKKQHKKEWDKLDENIDKLIQEMNRDEEISLMQTIFKSQNSFGKHKVDFSTYKEDLRKEMMTEEEKEKVRLQKERTFNGMSAREWVLNSRNVWNDVSSPRKSYHKEHGAVFPYKLAQRLIKMYSKKGDLVFDPFSGTSTTLNAAANEKRNAVGIELNDRFFDLSISILKDKEEFPLIEKSKILKENSNEFFISIEDFNLFNYDERQKNTLKLIKDDCRHMTKHISESSVQLIVTSPPYADFIYKSIKDRKKVHKKSLIKHKNNSTVNPYSNNDLDLGNLDYLEFMLEIEKIMKETYHILKPGGYAAWIVKDYKNKEWFSSYLDFHSDIAHAGKKAGLLYHDLIVWDQNEQRSLMLLGYPAKFHTNQNSSFIVILRKPTTKESLEIEKGKKYNEYK